MTLVNRFTPGCGNCGICLSGCSCTGEPLPYCFRVSGLSDNVLCFMSQLNRVYSRRVFGGQPLVLYYQGANGQLVTNTGLGSWPGLGGKFACYINEFEPLNDCGVFVGAATCAFGGSAGIVARVAIIKPEESDPTTTELHLVIGGLNISTTPASCNVLVHAKVVLTGLPRDCSADTGWLPMEIVSVASPALGIDYTGIALDIRLGVEGCEDDYYYDAEPKCCEERPSELYVTLFLNGSPVYEDEPIPLTSEDPVSFAYFEDDLGGFGSADILCVEDNDGTPYFSHPGAGIPGATLLTIESCDPFLATLTYVDGGDTYEVTITE